MAVSPPAPPAGAVAAPRPLQPRRTLSTAVHAAAGVEAPPRAAPPTAALRRRRQRDRTRRPPLTALCPHRSDAWPAAAVGDGQGHTTPTCAGDGGGGGSGNGHAASVLGAYGRAALAGTLPRAGALAAHRCQSRRVAVATATSEAAVDDAGGGGSGCSNLIVPAGGDACPPPPPARQGWSRASAARRRGARSVLCLCRAMRRSVVGESRSVDSSLWSGGGP